MPPANISQPAPSFAVSARAFGPNAERCSGIGSSMLIRPTSGFRKRTLCGPSSSSTLDGVAAEHALHHADVALHLGQRHGALPHRAPRGEAGADAEVDPAGRQLVQRGEPVRRDRRDPVRRDQDTRAQPDPLGLARGERHADEHVGVQAAGCRRTRRARSRAPRRASPSASSRWSWPARCRTPLSVLPATHHRRAGAALQDGESGRARRGGAGSGGCSRAPRCTAA